MATAKAALKLEPTVTTGPVANSALVGAPAPALPGKLSQRLPNALAGTEPSRSEASSIANLPAARPRRDPGANFQARVPIVIGEAVFRGWMPVDGIISGQLGASGSTLTVKQRPRSGPVQSEPELTGEISFKDMLRINGHVAATVTSPKGTLIVDGSARVDGDIDVGVLVVSGRVNGDVIADERVELGPAAVITGNISTRALTMKPGAVFQGDCRMMKDEYSDK